ncbi:MAG: imidazole glycerol phosphate synthase subunit HisH [Saprospiraceae bacterium]|nr:imidazole glycerol phosphate synthase subunit HisH [Saprospiraceae bacterium]MBL0099657.1 imidazole glycerol phosphate synthase subunit HisH [Saprospiraceae bacterium]
MTVIIDYKAGNTQSVMNVLDKIGEPYLLSCDPQDLIAAKRLILPGVGHAAPAMKQLQKQGLDQIISHFEKPFLGICLGMQIMYEYSEEGNTACLGLIPGTIRKFIPSKSLKVPHMGWNDIDLDINQSLFKGLNERESVYFVHSYFADFEESSTIGITEYARRFSAAVRYKNFMGLQFHPEKSGKVGQTMIENFIKMK